MVRLPTNTFPPTSLPPVSVIPPAMRPLLGIPGHMHLPGMPPPPMGMPPPSLFNIPPPPSMSQLKMGVPPPQPQLTPFMQTILQSRAPTPTAIPPPPGTVPLPVRPPVSITVPPTVIHTPLTALPPPPGTEVSFAKPDPVTPLSQGVKRPLPAASASLQNQPPAKRSGTDDKMVKFGKYLAEEAVINAENSLKSSNILSSSRSSYQVFA